MYNTLEDLKQEFDPYGRSMEDVEMENRKEFDVVDTFAFNLVYGDHQFPGGPNPEDYLPLKDPENPPQLLLFPKYQNNSLNTTNKDKQEVNQTQNQNQTQTQSAQQQAINVQALSLISNTQPKPQTQQTQKSESQALVLHQDRQVQPKENKEDKIELLKYRNPHLLEPSIFNIRDRRFYYQGDIQVRPYLFADIKLKRPFFYEINKIFREVYNLGIPLGSGSTASVRRCENRERANSKCAKMINIDCCKDLLNEMNILKKLYHPLVIDLYEVLEEPKKYYLIEELCMGGDVASCLAGRPCYSEEETAYIIKGALLSIAYCHNKRIVHRNVKPGNFVFKKTGSKMAKLIDFGNSADLSRHALPLKEIIGVPCYMAPEVLNESYNEKADIWSLGVMTYELLSKRLPFDAQSDQDMMLNIRHGSFAFDGPAWRITTDECKDLIKQMLAYNPNRRISARAALNHPWIQTKAPFFPDSDVISDHLQNMIECKFQHKLQEAILSMICHRMIQREELENLEMSFLCIDQDFDGLISYEEFLNAFTQHYKNPFDTDAPLPGDSQEVSQIIEQRKKIDYQMVFSRCDLDQDGYLDWHDFIMTACDKRRALSKHNLDEAFFSFDLYQKNYASFDDFESAFGKYQEQGHMVWDDIIKECIDNDDCLISMKDMEQLMLKMLYHKPSEQK